MWVRVSDPDRRVKDPIPFQDPLSSSKWGLAQAKAPEKGPM